MYVMVFFSKTSLFITVIYSFLTASVVSSELYTNPCLWIEKLSDMQNLKKLEGLMALYGVSCGHCEVCGFKGDSVHRYFVFRVKDNLRFNIQVKLRFGFMGVYG